MTRTNLISFRHLIVLLSVPAFFLQAADYNFIIKGGRYYLVDNTSPDKPNKEVTVQFMNIDGSVTPVPSPNPPVPQPSSLQKTVGNLTTQAILNGGTSTSAAAISSVYTLIADSVNKGDISPESSLSARDFLFSGLIPQLPDGSKWDSFRAEISKEIDKIRQDGNFKTKEQQYRVYKDIAVGINSSIGFNGSLTNPEQQLNPDAGILDKIDIAKLIELIKFFMELYKIFTGGL